MTTDMSAFFGTQTIKVSVFVYSGENVLVFGMSGMDEVYLPMV